MPKVLGLPRLRQPTTTGSLAGRMLASTRVLAETLPRGLNESVPVTLLLTLFVAEDEGRYLGMANLQSADIASPASLVRWIDALIDTDLVEHQGSWLALTQAGYDLVVSLLERIYVAQRALD